MFAKCDEIAYKTCRSYGAFQEILFPLILQTYRSYGATIGPIVKLNILFLHVIRFLQGKGNSRITYHALRILTSYSSASGRGCCQVPDGHAGQCLPG